MKLALMVAKVSVPTGRTLSALLTEGGAVMTTPDNADGIISYGVPYNGNRPCLNAKAGTFNNLQQLKLLGEKGVRIPPFVEDIENADWERIEFPLLSRELKHHGGKDIKPVMQQEEASWRKAAGANFFTQYIPIAHEYRAWVFRRRIQAMYQKEMKYPEKFKRIGRNFQNGFAFSFVEREKRPLAGMNQACKAVFALDLDFGAVDFIIGKDGGTYILEVNTAPGVSEGIRQGMQSLSNSIIKWAKNGFKKQSTKITFED
jgi:glutathione synthase/RimK-type ligase-like ATP-grasp enzyme